ncbi:MAG: hypothetical protein JW990_17680, partial [Thermoleophilia bacterium]|nr:hypothetical protein [Thermoleophilia bacterium]
MAIHKKRAALLAAIAVLAISGVLFGFALPSTAVAWDDCPRGVTTDCVYPGDCRHYVDTNGDDICDRSQSDPAATSTTTAPPETTTTVASETAGDGVSTDAAAAGAALASAGAASPTTSTTTPSSDGSGGSAVVAAATGEDDSGGIPFFTHYLVSPIALGFLLIYGMSALLYKTKRIRMATHRKIWNVLLLATFLITGIFGVILTIQLDYTLPFTIPVNLLFWHVEAGIVMTFISLFHMGWHFNYYRNLVRKSRCKARAARTEERLLAAQDRRLVVAAREQRRAARETGRTVRGAGQTARPDV